MKKYKYLLLAVFAILGLSSCSLDTDMYDQKNSDNSFTDLKSVKSGMIGAYYNLGDYGFLGDYAVIVGDMCSGVSNGSAASGHFYTFSTFTFSDTQLELENIWDDGYKVVTLSTRAINGAKQLEKDGKISKSEQPEASMYIGECYALKALANYYLVNLYGLPYSDANKSKPGIIVIDTAASVPLQQVKRGTVEESYAQILKDISSAEAAFNEAGTSQTGTLTAEYMGPMGLAALKARVYMSMGNYTEAKKAAEEAINLKGNGPADATDNVPSNSDYLSMWTKTDVSPEDLFTIKKSTDDNLSSNSLNVAYGSYYCTLQKAAYGKIASTDIRAKLLKDGDGGGITTAKYDGTSISSSTSNIPIFRKSEMALIIAECDARTGDLAGAKNYLMFTAKRNSAIKTTNDLPSTETALLQFISDERIREFIGEGHRFYDARRMGDVVSGDQFSNWDIKNFVFPIPASEVNSGQGAQQNENWSDNLPSIKQ
nr:RagB/SusD family nutrient uptake outer membrane protein [uncultured Prevotella sp.]